MEKILLLIVEDDIDVCDKFTNIIDKYEDIEIVKITNNAPEAIEALRELSPNAVILDLELHMGGGSGLDVLNAIHTDIIKYKPFILVTTNNPSNIILEYTRKRGVDYTCKKYQAGYSEEYVLNLLTCFKSHILSMEYAPKKDYSKLIFDELCAIGVSHKNKGFKYLTDAILLTINKPDLKITQELSIKYNKSEESIRKAMQHAINRTWNTQDIDVLLNNYSGKVDMSSGCPTATEFIKYYADKLITDYT